MAAAVGVVAAAVDTPEGPHMGFAVAVAAAAVAVAPVHTVASDMAEP